MCSRHFGEFHKVSHTLFASRLFSGPCATPGYPTKTLHARRVQVLAECADVPTYRFEPNHALDAETAAFVNQVHAAALGSEANRRERHFSTL